MPRDVAAEHDVLCTVSRGPQSSAACRSTPRTTSRRCTSGGARGLCERPPFPCVSGGRPCLGALECEENPRVRRIAPARACRLSRHRFTHLLRRSIPERVFFERNPTENKRRCWESPVLSRGTLFSSGPKRASSSEVPFRKPRRTLREHILVRTGVNEQHQMCLMRC